MSDTKKFILVAEDDKFYSKVYNSKLKESGYDVVVVPNGKLALSEAKKRTPNLIFLDLVMPEMDGFETLKEVKKDEKLKNVPVVVLSNLGQEEDKKKVAALGADKYVVKSDISLDDLIDLAKGYLKA